MKNKGLTNYALYHVNFDDDEKVFIKSNGIKQFCENLLKQILQKPRSGTYTEYISDIYSKSMLEEEVYK